MRDVQVDLETLGQTPGCVILSLGAVAFDPTKLGPEFYAVINTEDCLKYGLFKEDSTVQWWAGQSEQAREVLKLAANKKTSMPLKMALTKYFDYLKSDVGKPSMIRQHSCGAGFDLPIIAVAAHRVGLKLPTQFWNDRCHRTNKAKAPKSSEPKREGTYHNALDDAKHQARHAQILAREHGISVFS